MLNIKPLRKAPEMIQKQTKQSKIIIFEDGLNHKKDRRNNAERSKTRTFFLGGGRKVFDFPPKTQHNNLFLYQLLIVECAPHITRPYEKKTKNVVIDY